MNLLLRSLKAENCPLNSIAKMLIRDTTPMILKLGCTYLQRIPEHFTDCFALQGGYALTKLKVWRGLFETLRVLDGIWRG